MPWAVPQRIDLPPSGIVAVESRHDPAFQMEAQQHEFHEVFLLLRGTVTVGLAGGERRVMHPGDYLIVPAGMEHTIHDDRASTLVLIACSDAALDAVPGRRDVWRRLTGRREAPGEATATSPILSAAPLHLQDPAWRDLLAVRDGAHRLEVENAFSRFLVHLNRLAARPRAPTSRERLEALVERLAGRAHEAWTLDRAAAEVHLSRRRFSELWREVTGRSFVASLQGTRVTNAQRLMRDDGLSIVAAAFAVGFNDVANFYRVFRRHTGVAPGAWAKESEKLHGSVETRTGDRR